MQKKLFHTELREYLQEYHPLLVKNSDFLENRVEQAKQTFQSCEVAGMSFEDSMQEARITLYAGLHFSVYTLITDILDEEFTGLSFLPSAKFAKELMQVLQPILANYHIDDNFERTSAYDSLYNELTEAIGNYIEDKGLS